MSRYRGRTRPGAEPSERVAGQQPVAEALDFTTVDSRTGLPVVGMVGAGQLARMTHQAAIALGQSLRLLADSADDGAALVASDARAASALLSRPGFTATSTGYRGTSDSWKDLTANGRMDRRYSSAGPGNLVQTGQTPLTGLAHRQHLTASREPAQVGQ